MPTRLGSDRLRSMIAASLWPLRRLARGSPSSCSPRGRIAGSDASCASAFQGANHGGCASPASRPESHEERLFPAGLRPRQRTPCDSRPGQQAHGCEGLKFAGGDELYRANLRRPTRSKPAGGIDLQPGPSGRERSH